MPTIDASFTGSSVRTAIASAAATTGVDFTYLLQQARVESGFDPNARARTSSATGLYQFIEQSWLGTIKAHGAEHGLGWAADAIARGADGRWHVDDATARSAILNLRRDPAASATMAAELASDNQAALETRLGRAVQPVDLYLAHFLGIGAATKFLKAAAADPAQSAAPLFPAAARANHAVFYARDGSARSLAEVRDRFATRFDASANPSDAVRSPSPRWLASATSTRTAAAPAPAPAHASAPAPANARLAYLMLASLGVS